MRQVGDIMMEDSFFHGDINGWKYPHWVGNYQKHNHGTVICIYKMKMMMMMMMIDGLID